MNDEQYKRFRKMKNENIQCLFTLYKAKTLYFLVVGSTGTKYKVCIKNTGQISCSCPDFKNGAQVQECVCKHCLYIIFEYLGVIKDVDHCFFERRFFTKDEMMQIFRRYKELKQ